MNDNLDINCADRTAIVAYMGEQAVDELLAMISDHEVEIIRQPRTGLIMMPLTDSFMSDFNLGEVLVTETVVKIEGVEGYGMVAGENPRSALARAAAEAILKGKISPVRTALEALLERQESLLQEAHLLERALTESTRVSFDLMTGA